MSDWICRYGPVRVWFSVWARFGLFSFSLETEPDRTGPDRTGMQITVRTGPDRTKKTGFLPKKMNRPDRTGPDRTGITVRTGPDRTQNNGFLPRKMNGPDRTGPDRTVQLNLPLEERRASAATHISQQLQQLNQGPTESVGELYSRTAELLAACRQRRQRAKHNDARRGSPHAALTVLVLCASMTLLWWRHASPTMRTVMRSGRQTKRARLASRSHCSSDSTQHRHWPPSIG